MRIAISSQNHQPRKGGAVGEPVTPRAGRARRRLFVLVFWWVASIPALAQSSQPTSLEDVSGLRAEVRVDKSLYLPGEPIHARFTLVNEGAAAIEITTVDRGEPTDLIGLPPDLIYGTKTEPALFLQYEAQAEAPVPPDSPPPPPGAGVRSLRLAPGSTLGAIAPLTQLQTRLRYSGEFVLTWKPFGGRLESASARFRVEPRQDAIFVTDYGKITFVLRYDEAPRNVENFLDLVRSRFYDGTVLHRLIPGYLVQGGSPDGRGDGIRPDGRTVPAEFTAARFDLGTLAMARRPNDPDSASCQFFICLGRAPDLDGQYTVIGQSSDPASYETLRQIAAQPTDAKNRPLHPIVIRSVTLLNAASDRTRSIGAP